MAFNEADLRGSKILVTGASGLVAQPIVRAFSPIANVFAAARFLRPEDREAVKRMGAVPVTLDLARRETLSAVPGDLDYVINCAVTRTGSFEHDLAVNGDATGHLMARCRSVKAFLHISTTGVYEYRGQQPIKESDPLGDSHRAMFPTYSIAKIAAERVCIFAAQQFGIPTTIARLNVPYGDNGAWPYFHLMMMRNGAPVEVHPERPNYYNPIHAEDLIEKLPRLLACATPEVTITNLGGSQQVSIEQWCDYLGELIGVRPQFVENPKALGSVCIDLTRMHSLIGETKVEWRSGMRRMVQSLAPDLITTA
ncbi:MAG TPA: NAD(P)-dependent oxidoreductase [Candidatus Binataceae bacterium]|nr:NAD(P)-dependent oxidoreductase [Candidatus Binataceae bacterium]